MAVMWVWDCDRIPGDGVDISSFDLGAHLIVYSKSICHATFLRSVDNKIFLVLNRMDPNQPIRSLTISFYHIQRWILLCGHWYALHLIILFGLNSNSLVVILSMLLHNLVSLGFWFKLLFFVLDCLRLLFLKSLYASSGGWIWWDIGAAKILADGVVKIFS